MILLTEEENPYKPFDDPDYSGDMQDRILGKSVAFNEGAKAQARKMKNWLELHCESGGPRRACGHCWQSLLKELE